MTVDVKPSVLRSAVTAWGDSCSAIGRMPLVAGIAFALQLALWYIVPSQLAASLGWSEQIVSFALWIVTGFLMTPLVIAVHRYVLLGEPTRNYPLNPSNPRFLHFFSFAVVLVLLWEGLRMLFTIQTPFSESAPPVPDLVGLTKAALFLASVALFIIAIVVMLRSIILFPAIAIDAPGAGWRNAIRDSKGHTWRVLFTMVFTLLPFIAVWGVVYVLFLQTVVWRTLPVMAGTQAAINVMTLCVLAAAASRLFRAFASKLSLQD
jgi:hypothetical protein